MATDNVSVVLVHGAWADGSSWAGVIAALKEVSVKVSAAPLPLTSLADDVTALNRSLDPLLADRFHMVAPDLPGFGNRTCRRERNSRTHSTILPT
jgi:pimeloyl-ACP methyl ester carboxylesterase